MRKTWNWSINCKGAKVQTWSHEAKIYFSSIFLANLIFLFFHSSTFPQNFSSLKFKTSYFIINFSFTLSWQIHCSLRHVAFSKQQKQKTSSCFAPNQKGTTQTNTLQDRFTGAPWIVNCYFFPLTPQTYPAAIICGLKTILPPCCNFFVYNENC